MARRPARVGAEKECDYRADAWGRRRLVNIDNPGMTFRAVRALSFDLDDTLWPIAPVIAGAEQKLRQWLEMWAPATAAAFDAQGMRTLRSEIEREQPALVHDLTAMRRLTLQRAIMLAGEPARLADQAFEVFFEARQQVEFFPEVLPSLERLARRYRMVSLSNGNADLQRVGLAHLFSGSISAREVGCAKPDRRIFDAASRHLGFEPSQILHVGDHFEMDVAGARAAGMMAVWLRRPDLGPAAADDGMVASGSAGDRRCDDVIADLDELVRRLGC